MVHNETGASLSYKVTIFDDETTEASSCWASGTLDSDLGASGQGVGEFALLVEDYEEKHEPILPDPVQAIRFRMEQLGLDRKALEPAIGSRARVSEVLSRRRRLTLDMIRRLTSSSAFRQRSSWRSSRGGSSVTMLAVGG